MTTTGVRLPVSLSLLAFALTLTVAGCSGGPAQREQLPARFEPSILANGTKLFTYTVDLPPQPSASLDRPTGGARPIRIDNLLEAALAENNYCREGWLVIDRYQTLRLARARGECKEAASAADLERYSR